MTTPTTRISFRFHTDELARMREAAHRVGMSLNRYMTAAGLAYTEDAEQAQRVDAIVGAQTAKLVDALAEQFQHADEAATQRDKALRDDVNSVLRSMRQRIDALDAATKNGGA